MLQVRQVVQDRWLELNGPIEGGLPYLYADKLGLVTTGYGDLVDPVSMALGLPWMVDGRRARSDEIAVAWWTVKNDPMAAVRGHLYAKDLPGNQIRLLPAAVDDLVFAKLRANDEVLQGMLPDFAEWPACAQMALHSWAWACGPHAHFPRLIAACRARDFDQCAVEIHLDEKGNPGLAPRNVADVFLMRNAARVQAFKLDPDLIEWTRDLGVAEITTAPEMENPASCPTLYCAPVDVEPDDAA